jgi:hypothetical protein
VGTTASTINTLASGFIAVRTLCRICNDYSSSQTWMMSLST